VFKNRVLRRIGPKRDEMSGDWRRLQNEEPHKLYASPNVVRVTKSSDGGACSMHGRDEKYIQKFGRKT
jgi:hypothetical protein